MCLAKPVPSIGREGRGEHIKYRKVNRVRWGQLGSDVEGLCGTLGSAQHVEWTRGTEPGWGFLSIEIARLEMGLGPFTL